MKILVLGASGMLGNAVFRTLSATSGLNVVGTLRSDGARRHFAPELQASLVSGVDVEREDSLVRIFTEVQPDVVVNCVGLIKQLGNAKDPIAAIPINAMLPHRLSLLCELVEARLIHVSTDCVFAGDKGRYLESDTPDATDVYGRTKLLGEVEGPHAVTLRTSIIGHELNSHFALVDWFLAQSGSVKGFRRAVFSGLPTVELAEVIRDYVLPNPGLSGLYHVSVDPINKFDLLSLVADVYGKDIEITPNDDLVIDRSLNSDRFRAATGFRPKPWRALVEKMHLFA
ncbi:dTDP-4-dehydrorhamnose reductase [Pandoraea pnomenusa 3kgm]|uniref:dTDP-4-dehydrorhamnose reductase family protein n=1 Tax=Pandoraea pnomenusa TaxID=93220 RepID=UPI0003C7734C|nr:SDR family oxidoreductase [Pandoraea pnomenusa]AHB08132.1 dTDP-4-dehydrorhamnose reductase [Pandoraea pnomenusa 3kgm]